VVLNHAGVDIAENATSVLAPEGIIKAAPAVLEAGSKVASAVKEFGPIFDDVGSLRIGNGNALRVSDSLPMNIPGVRVVPERLAADVAGGEASSASIVGQDAAKVANPIQRYEVTTFKESVQRSAKGDAISGDHIPSRAAIQKNVETTLGRRLNPTEQDVLTENTHVVNIDHDLHAAGDTYGRAKNTAEQISEDARDLHKAALGDQATHLKNAEAMGYDTEKLKGAFKTLNERNKELFAKLSTPDGIIKTLQQWLGEKR
jgi:hypothetical protein